MLLLAPILAAFAQQQLTFAFVTWACSRNGLWVLLHIPTLLALTVTGAAALIAWRTLRRVGIRQPGDERSADARARFMSFGTLAMAGFCVLLIVAQWLPTVFLHPCQR
jgi:hypothetical protein